MELKLDQWATTPPVGYPGAVPPPPGKRSAGFTNGEEPPAGYFNHAWDALADTQNELANLITGAGLTRSESDLSQVLAAVKRMGVARVELAGITQWVDIYNGAFTNPRSIAASPTALVAVGYNAASSIRRQGLDQFAWTTPTTPAGFTTGYNDVCWSAAFNRFVAVGGAREIHDSPDGVTWTRRASGTGEWAACVSGASAVVAVGVNGIIASSTNGTTWTDRTSAHPGATMWGAAYSPSLNRFCVTGGVDVTCKIQCSDATGTVWTAATSPPAAESLSGIVWSAEHAHFYAWSVEGVFKSPDGMTWTPATDFMYETGAGAVILPAHLAVFGGEDPGIVRMYRVDELDGTPTNVLKLSLLFLGATQDHFTRVIRVPPDSGNAFAGRLLGLCLSGKIRASHYLG